MKATQLPKPLKRKPVQACKARVEAAKPNLPEGWVSILIRHYPEYDTIAGGHLLKNIIAGRSSDLIITEIIEKIANKELI